MITDLFLLVAILNLPLAWLLDPFRINLGLMHFTISWGLKPVLAIVLILAVRAILAMAFRKANLEIRGLWEAAVFKRVCFGLITTYVVFALFELVLTWTKFNVELPPIVFQGKSLDGNINIHGAVADPDLLFRFQPGAYFEGRRINSLGFREREVDPLKQNGTVRVICMGDSVTGQGRPGYSQYLHELLTNNPPTPTGWEAFHMGVHGYTSLQGLRLFQKTGRLLQPDIVTMYYGWNDHWLTAVPDRQKMGLEMRPFAGRLFELLRKKRIFRFVVWALNPVQHLATRDPSAGYQCRVGPEEYRSTLKAFVREIRTAGAIPVLITAPRRSLTDHLVHKNYALSVEDAERVHDKYVDITREVARDSGAELLDLAALFADQKYDAYFAPDGIHFDYYAKEGQMTNDLSQPGLMGIAHEFDRKVRKIVSAHGPNI